MDRISQQAQAPTKRREGNPIPPTEFGHGSQTKIDHDKHKSVHGPAELSANAFAGQAVNSVVKIIGKVCCGAHGEFLLVGVKELACFEARWRCAFPHAKAG